MTAKSYKSHVATEAASGKREKRSRTSTVTGIPVPDHSERDGIIKRLQERKAK
jgi:hypothetical protein